MTYLARIPLESGGSALLEASTSTDGPVKAGRLGDAIHDLPLSLQNALDPVVEVARVTIERLRKAGPAQVEVEFGVDLAVEAGAVITKGKADCHLTITVVWKREQVEHGGEQAD